MMSKEKKRALSLSALIKAYKDVQDRNAIGTPEHPSDCPFCGSYDCEMIEETQVIHNEYVEYYVVGCKVCECRAPIASSEEGAWQLWNKRKNHSPLCPQEH